MNENTLQTTNNLKRCKVFIEQLEEQTSAYNKIISKTVNLELERDELNKQIPSKTKKIFQMIFFTFGIALLLFYIIGSNYLIPDMLSSNVGSIILIVLCFAIGLIVSYWLVIVGSKKQAKKIEEMDAEIKEGNTLSYRIQTEISDLLKSEEGQFTASIIPPAYRKSKAINRFIYYFENGHVDTMKEAVKEYDQYIHNKKMENEAHRTTVAAEATEIATKQTAKSASEAAFWSLYNAYLNEK